MTLWLDIVGKLDGQDLKNDKGARVISKGRVQKWQAFVFFGYLGVNYYTCHF